MTNDNNVTSMDFNSKNNLVLLKSDCTFHEYDMTTQSLTRHFMGRSYMAEHGKGPIFSTEFGKAVYILADFGK